MWFNVLLLVLVCACVHSSDDGDEHDLYYYGLEESERGLPSCSARQACAALLQRAWRAPALVRLCRCQRRRRCDARAPAERQLELNNRAHLQFCKPVATWPECPINEKSLTVVTSARSMNPDDLEGMHHRNIQISPPELTFKCRCRKPNYWKLSSRDDTNVTVYQCSTLHLCNTGEHCGNVSNDLNALYQSCLCPRRHICVHNGGIPHSNIAELLYEGKGWKAYCQRVGEEYSYEEY